jgi:monoterpene epsilon-lactone hydrolase
LGLTAESQKALGLWQTGSAVLGKVLQGESELTWEQGRAVYIRAMAEAFPDSSGAAVTSTDLGGVRATVITPAEVIGRRILFYIHGGGYVSGSPDAYYGLAGRYATLLRAEVMMPDYRLAPQHAFPAPIEDVVTAYKALLERVDDPRSIVVSGDSAGGAMVVTLMRKLRDAGLPLPVAGVAISPWANLAHTGASMNEREGLDPLCSRQGLTLMARTFLGNALPTDPDASPINADVRGLSPVLIQIGENEVMLSDAIRLAAHLGESRVKVSLEIWPGMFHVWHLLGEAQPEAKRALENAVTFLEQALDEAHTRV